MAEVAENLLLLLPLEDDHDLEEETLEEEEEASFEDSSPYWIASAFDSPQMIIHHHHPHLEEEEEEDSLDPDLFVPVFSPSSDLSLHHHQRRIHAADSDSDSEYNNNNNNNYLDDDDRVNLTLDLFNRHVTTTTTTAGQGLFPEEEEEEDMDPMGFRVFDGVALVDEMGDSTDYLELGLGLGLGFEKHGGIREEEEEEDSAWDGDDGFFVPTDSCGSGGGGDGETSLTGLRIVGFGSDSSDSDGENEAHPQITVMGSSDDGGSISGSALDRIPDDLGIPLCWDCLHIEGDRRDPIEEEEEFEWEEVDDRADDEREEVLNMMLLDADADDESARRREDEDLLDHVHGETNGEEEEEEQVFEEEEEETARHIEWEVLLAVNNLERNPSIVDHHGVPEDYLGDDHDGYVYTSEYEILFGQFADHDSAVKGSPPAAKSAVKNLPSVVLTREDVAKGNTLCAVCKDEISLQETAKRLPCSHHYHGDCILPWLGIRNTCPVCRYELPTDDPDYESSRARRASRGRPVEESPVRLGWGDA